MIIKPKKPYNRKAQDATEASALLARARGDA